MINNKKMGLLNYINKPISKESIEILYAANNIKYEKCVLYGDFVLSLVTLIFDTYLGDEFTNQIEQKNHFKWCWAKTIESFERENIYVNSPKLYKYFYDFMFQVFYTVPKANIKLNNILRLWEYIFNYKNEKSKSDVDTLIEVYKLFESGTTFK